MKTLLTIFLILILSACSSKYHLQKAERFEAKKQHQIEMAIIKGAEVDTNRNVEIITKYLPGDTLRSLLFVNGSETIYHDTIHDTVHSIIRINTFINRTDTMHIYHTVVDTFFQETNTSTGTSIKPENQSEKGFWPFIKKLLFWITACVVAVYLSKVLIENIFKPNQTHGNT